MKTSWIKNPGKAKPCAPHEGSLHGYLLEYAQAAMLFLQYDGSPYSSNIPLMASMVQLTRIWPLSGPTSVLAGTAP